MTGSTTSTDFPTTPGAFQTKNLVATSSLPTGFVTKLNSVGSALVYSTYLGGSGFPKKAGTDYSSSPGDIPYAIRLNIAGNAYVAGQASSADFPVLNAYQATNHGAPSDLPNAFVSELNPAGTALVFSTFLGGTGASPAHTTNYENGQIFVHEGDQANALALDDSGNVYIAGQAYSGDFPVSADALQKNNLAYANFGSNAFLAQLSPSGNGLLYSTYLGGAGGTTQIYGSAPSDPDSPGLDPLGGDAAIALAVNASVSVYLAGKAASADFPVTRNALQLTNHNQIFGYNVFLTKLNFHASAPSPLTTTTLTSDNASPIQRQKVTFIATVTPDSSSVVPLGSVSFYDNYYNVVTLLGGARLVAASGGGYQALFQTSFSLPFNHVISAIYNGYGSSITSTGVLPEVVSFAPPQVIDVFLTNLTQAYTGAPLSPTVATHPSLYPATLTFNGSPNAPTAPGTYTVVATVIGYDEVYFTSNYLACGTANATFTITKP